MTNIDNTLQVGNFLVTVSDYRDLFAPGYDQAVLYSVSAVNPATGKHQDLHAQGSSGHASHPDLALQKAKAFIATLAS